MQTVLGPSDLVTTHAARIAGFQWQATQKATLGTQFFAVANHFANKASTITSIVDIWNDPQLKEFALAASSLSKKSLNHISDADQRLIVAGVINFSMLKTPSYVTDMQRRYLLTCGDSLGGSMRNIVGQTAQKKLSDLILIHLANNHFIHSTIINRDGKLTEIHWTNPSGSRKIFFDKKVNFIGNNIDFIVLNGTYNKESPSDYVACGELKGGIDPAGADEHWKTARSALDRIRLQFSNRALNVPPLFFIAAAIENSMASEIFTYLTSNQLTAAANFTVQNQMDELVNTLINL